MEASKLLTCLITATLILEVSCLNLNNSDHLTASKLPKFICNVIKSAKREDSGLKTVAFVTTENQLEHSMIDDVMRCKPMEISTTFIDLMGIEDKMDVKAQLVVILADQIDGSSHGMSSLLSANHMSKFLVVTSDPEKLNLQNVQKLLNSNGIQNFAIITAENDSVAVQRPEIFNGEVKVVQKLKKSQLSRQLFPDKLNNLNGYKYKVAIDFSSYPITSRNNRIVQRTSHLFRTIAKSQNATAKNIRVKEQETFQQQKFDFIVDSKFSLQRHSTSSVLYNGNRFCILLPKVNKFTTSPLLTSQTGDAFIVGCFLVINFGIFIIWRLYKGRGAVESAWVITFKILATYNGQNVQISRQNRLVLTIFVQILMVMAIFSNIINQWSIGTSLAYPQGELSLRDTYKSFTYQNDTKIAVDAIMDGVIPILFRSYHSIKAANRLVLFDERNFDMASFNHQKIGVVGQCEFVKTLATQKHHFFVYPMPSILSSTQVRYGPQNPFTEKIEKLISYAFEAGLSEVWETTIKMRIFGPNYQKSEAETQIDIFDILGFDKLMPSFYGFFRSIAAAVVVFILEIFYHGCIRHLSWQLIRYWTSSMISRTSEHQNENINWQRVGRIRRAWYFWRQRRNLKIQRVNVRRIDV